MVRPTPTTSTTIYEPSQDPLFSTSTPSTSVPTTLGPLTAPRSAHPTTPEPAYSSTQEPTPPLSPAPSSTNIVNAACDWLYVDIFGFNQFTASYLNHDATLQSKMSNITREAIGESTRKFNNDPFSVSFENATGALSITFALCALTNQTLLTIQLITQNTADDISDAMTDGLAEEFGVEQHSMTVAVYFTNSEFSCNLTICTNYHYVPFAMMFLALSENVNSDYICFQTTAWKVIVPKMTTMILRVISRGSCSEL